MAASLPPAAALPAAGGGRHRGGDIYAATQSLLQRNREAEIQLKSNPRKVNLVKEKANARVEREMNLLHFKELLQIFCVSRRRGGEGSGGGGGGGVGGKGFMVFVFLARPNQKGEKMGGGGPGWARGRGL
ncbi:MAG: hypothetical protein BJ554DRAFT_2564 [Olpidium bornovanus]|uniref:Uncharacterized protein n=1 Tax=Olpidium bornovanus TaxID=278681 RepID=A0A8H7ZQA0_9FUNG|nr:MAG: hypothetical protein BJ554DRAFT_2564 [Olpidium bornovanus]